ncbi:hypothetical protein FA95DRAFT_1613628 [Auriscalpium vulgare]|uniref:Uncharacterized protein n=1 Tax=Auriscalpium vulgare TaxID=40419 RepID=A0ACB8R1X6_9AGAM|nr:hypothetical protein FA95DRAFT_1613628 [Auriscalpium vulgare]
MHVSREERSKVSPQNYCDRLQISSREPSSTTPDSPSHALFPTSSPTYSPSFPPWAGPGDTKPGQGAQNKNTAWGGCSWDEVFLARAQDAPLTITNAHNPRNFFAGLRPLRPAGLTFLRNDLARTRNLCLISSETNTRVLCAPAPLLETLHLTYVNGMRRVLKWSNLDAPTPPAAPGDLLDGAANASALRHLRIHVDGPLPWTSLLLIHLTSLDVTTSSASRTVHDEEFADMPHALGRMPALEHIALELELGKTGAAQQPVVALAKLRELELETAVAHAARILAHIALPTTAAVRCQLDTYPSADLTHSSAPPPDASTLTLPPYPASASSRPQTNCTAAEVSQSTDGLTRDLLGAALDTLDSVHLRELVVRGSEMGTAWPEELRYAPMLRRIRVVLADGAALPFCSTVALDPDGFLPVLSALVIVGEEFCVGSEGDAHELADALARCLAARARRACAGRAKCGGVQRR